MMDVFIIIRRRFYLPSLREAMVASVILLEAKSSLTMSRNRREGNQAALATGAFLINLAPFVLR